MKQIGETVRKVTKREMCYKTTETNLRKNARFIQRAIRSADKPFNLSVQLYR